MNKIQVLGSPVYIRFHNGFNDSVTLGPFEQINVGSDGNMTGGDMMRTPIAGSSGGACSTCWSVMLPGMTAPKLFSQFYMFGSHESWSEIKERQEQKHD